MRILSVFIFLFYNCCFSQFKITHYNSENGLPHDLCYQIIQDKSGYIWLGTDNGLVKFNGNTFVSYAQNQGLQSGFVIGVSESISKDKKIIATWGAGAYYFSNGKFTPIGDKDFRHQKLNHVVEYKDKIVAVENKSRLRVYQKGALKSALYDLYKIKGRYRWFSQKEADKIKDYFRKNKIGSELIQIVKVNNQLYCISDKYTPKLKGILKFDCNSKTIFPFPFLKDIPVVGLYSKEGHFLAVTENELIEFDSKRILSRRKSNLPGKRIIQYAENQESEAYLVQDKATNNHEVVLYGKKTGKYTFLSEDFLKAPVSDILLSNEGILWISTYGNGLFSVKKPQIQMEENYLENQYVFDFESTKFLNFFVGTDKIIYSDKKNTDFKEIPVPGIVHFKNQSADTLYMQTKKPDAFSKQVGPYFLTNKTRMYQKKIGAVEFVFGDALLYVKKNGKLSEVFLKVPNSEENNLKIQGIVKTGNEYWVLSNQGIFVLDENLKNNRRVTEKEGLLSNQVIDVAENGSQIWMLGLKGLTIYEKGKFSIFSYDNDKNDFFNDFVIEKNGTAWIASQKGLVRFNDGQFYRFTRKEGLASSFYSRIYILGKDKLLCMGNKGVNVFDMHELKKANHLAIHLNSNSGGTIKDDEMKIDSHENFAVTADVINFSDSDYLLEYKLNNEKWVKLEGNTVDFSNFSSGKFTLQFRARYYFSDWSYSSRVIIDKVPAWYFRWYVLLSGVFLVLGVIFGIINLRFKRLRERTQKLQDLLDSNQRLEMQLNEMRQNIAQDFHDELGNKLAGITVMSDQLMHAEKLKDSDDYAVVERINKDSQDLFQGIRDFIWAIDSKNGSLEELIFALTDFGENLFEYSNIKFIVTNHVENSAFLLPHYWNRQLLLLFKEAMTNSFKYSQAKTGTLIFKMEEGILFVEFKDDGIGFDPKTISRRNGLFNLQKRADKLKGQLKINSISGTSVVFIGEM
ncbi:hypothetical protein NAT51_18865 [Flavobacterium amniphilum]|uniref:sensor histidine kinase n=1 Tax=Flavobacterium amniphilum TaxID=1834035 RepID=UPI002029C072|nr:two-component regulator propeller domain-containing protein [Flavobacterium amniphilum]MCL9807592.1 hypothetical protein [Flavobacterium amniphilum]